LEPNVIRNLMLAVMAVGICSACNVGGNSPPNASAQSTGRPTQYRVIDLDKDENRNIAGEGMEAFLNQQAAAGWRLHSVMMGGLILEK
jgi:hypothetical protein